MITITNNGVASEICEKSLVKDLFPLLNNKSKVTGDESHMPPRYTKDRNLVAKKPNGKGEPLSIYNSEKIRMDVRYDLTTEQRYMEKVPSVFYQKFHQTNDLKQFPSILSVNFLVYSLFSNLENKEKKLFVRYFKEKFKAISFKSRVNFDLGANILYNQAKDDTVFITTYVRDCFVTNNQVYRGIVDFLDITLKYKKKRGRVCLSNLYSNRNSICWGYSEEDVLAKCQEITNRDGLKFEDETSNYGKFITNKYFSLLNNFDIDSEFLPKKPAFDSILSFIANYDFTDFLNEKEARILNNSIRKSTDILKERNPVKMREYEVVLLCTMFDIPFYEFSNN